MSAIIAEKQIVVRAIDKVSEPLARMDRSLASFVSKFGSLDSHLTQAATSQSTFRGALQQTRASLREASTSATKLGSDIAHIKGKKVDVKADTAQATKKVDAFQRNVRSLRNPIIKAKANTSEAKGQLNSLKHTAESVGHSFTRLRTIIAGTAFGTAIGSGLYTAFSNIKMGITGAMRAGIEFDMTMQKMHATWDTLTGSAGKAKSMSNSIVDLSNKLGWSVDVTNELAQQFYHVFDNQPETMKLTKSFLIMGDAIGLSSDRLKQVGMDFTHMISSSKLQLGDLNQITDAFPMFGEALLKYERKVQHNSHLTMSQLRDDISAGKISAKDAETVFNQLGDKYKNASENLMGTLPGMFRQIKSKWKQLMGDAMAPSVNAANPIVKQVSEWVGDKNTTKEFKNLGKAVNNGVGSIMKALADNFGDGSVSKMLDNVVNGLTRFVKATSKWTANNAGSIVKTIKSIASISGSLGKGFFDAISDMLKAISGASGHGLEGIANSLKAISKHKTALSIIGRILAVQFAYGKLFKIAEGLGLINKALVNAGKAKFTGNIFKDFVRGLKKFKNFKGDSSFTKAVGPKGVLAQEAEKGGESAGKGFMSRMFSRLKGTKVGGRFSSMFKGITRGATASGDKAGGSFVARLLSKVKGVKVEGLGRGLGSKLGGAFALAFGAIDLFKALSSKKDKAAKVGKSLGETAGGMGGAAIGASLGSVVPGIGTLIGGLLGGLIGSKAGGKIGKAIGKSWGAIKKGAAAVGKFIFKVLTMPFKAAFKVGEWFGNKIKGFLHHKSGQPSSKEIKSLGGNHYSRADIANIKEMNRAVKAYIRTLKSLKSTIKHNDPTKELNKMNRHLKTFAKNLSKSAKPLKSVAKTFKTFGNATKKMARSIKTLTGKHGLGEFAKDLKSLNKAMKKAKLDTYFKKLAKSIKKSKLASEFKSLSKSLKSMVKQWKELQKPLKSNEKALNGFEKVIKKLTNKKTGLKALDTDIIKLSKDLRKYNFGKTLSRQMAEANKAVGKHGFVKEFNSMVKTVESDLKSFKKTFDNDWGRIWKNLDRDVSRGLRSALRAEDSGMDSMRSKESHFTSSFKKSWSGWLDDLVSAMRSAFDKLPGIAGKAMSGIVGRLNKGISGINKVIGDFGGDKKLGMISYAHGTFAHPGGKAIVNDALTPNKTELIYQPSRGWGFARGQNVVRDLEAGSMVLDAQHSAPIFKRLGMPHYADGTLSDDEMDKIAEAFEKNAVAASKQLMLKLTNWSSSTPIVPTLGKAEAIGLSRGIANVLKDLLGEVKNPVNGDWTPVIRSAAAHMGVHLSAMDIKRILNTIAHESGGRQDITQPGADPDGDGSGPARGLLQFKTSTFNHYKVHGHGNIYSGYDQLLALFNDSNWREDLRWNGGWSPSGGRVRAANGAHFTSMTNALVGDNPEHDEYVINPYNASSVPLMRDAWRDMENAHPELRQDTSSANFNSQVVGLLKTVVSTIKNIDFAPEVNVDTMRKAINKQNAIDYRLM